MIVKNPIKYVYLLEKVYKEEIVECPECGAPGLMHDFYADKTDRIGFAQFKCNKCGAEAHLSRVKFPEGIKFKDIN